MTNEQQQLTTLLLNLLPADHTTVGNSTLLEQFLAAAQAEGHQPPATEDDFKTAREALVARRWPAKDMAPLVRLIADSDVDFRAARAAQEAQR